MDVLRPMSVSGMRKKILVQIKPFQKSTCKTCNDLRKYPNLSTAFPSASVFESKLLATILRRAPKKGPRPYSLTENGSRVCKT